MCDGGRGGGLPRDGFPSPSSLDLAGYTGVGLRETEAGQRLRWSHRALLASHRILACPSGSLVRAAPRLPETQSGLCFWTSLAETPELPSALGTAPPLAYLPVPILSKRNTIPPVPKAAFSREPCGLGEGQALAGDTRGSWLQSSHPGPQEQ